MTDWEEKAEKKAEKLRRVILACGHQLARELPPKLARVLEIFARVAQSKDASGLQEEIAGIPPDEHEPSWESIEVHGWKIMATMYLRSGQLWWLVHAQRENENSPSEVDIDVLDKVLGHLGAEPDRHAVIGPSSRPAGEPPLPIGWWTWRNGWLLYQTPSSSVANQAGDRALFAARAFVARWARDTGEVLSAVVTDRMLFAYEMGYLRGHGEGMKTMSTMFDQMSQARAACKEGEDDGDSK